MTKILGYTNGEIKQAVYYVDNACGYHRTAYKSSD